MLSCFRHAWLFVTLWTLVLQAPLFMGFSRQEYWSGLLCPPPGDLSDPGIELMSLKSPSMACRFFTTSTTWENSGTISFLFFLKLLQFWPLGISNYFGSGSLWVPNSPHLLKHYLEISDNLKSETVTLLLLFLFAFVETDHCHMLVN